jgi:transcriptional regulator with XRE-family HTH domain
MKSSKKEWAIPDISSVEEAIKELRHGLRISAKGFAAMLGISRTTLHRYENGELPPLPALCLLLRIALEKDAPYGVAKMLAEQLAEELRITPVSILIAVLMTLEGPDAPRHVARLARQAQEILESE